MAEPEKVKETKEEKEMIEEVVEPVVLVSEEEKAEAEVKKKKEFDVSSWNPKTDVGRKIKNGEIKDLSEILNRGSKIMEPEIVEILMPDYESDLLMIGQAKGKFGGGQRRVFMQTQKKTKEGNKPKFSTYAVVGNKNGYVGVGYGKSKETVPAREKSLRNAKLNVFKIIRGCGSWECNCKEPHSIPFAVEGKSGSFKIRLMPAPKGTGMCVEKEAGKILSMAGIKDIWSRTEGQTRNKINVINATIEALKNLSKTKVKSQHYSDLGMKEGKVGSVE
jgi:small subunit ribosomal protein S5